MTTTRDRFDTIDDARTEPNRLRHAERTVVGRRYVGIDTSVANNGWVWGEKKMAQIVSWARPFEERDRCELGIQGGLVVLNCQFGWGTVMLFEVTDGGVEFEDGMLDVDLDARIRSGQYVTTVHMYGECGD